MSISSDEATTKRQRVSRACDLCRKKKIKCDGTSPMCGNCHAFHLNCSYKDTTKKRGPPKGYIEAIENRLHKLEAYLNDVAKDEQADSRTLELIQELQSPLQTSGGEKINGRPQRRQRRSNKQYSTTKTYVDTVSMNSPLSPLFGSPTWTHNELADDQTISTAVKSPANDSTGQLSMDENGGVRYLGKSSGFYLLSNSRTYQNGAFHFSGYAHQFKVDQQQQQQQQLSRKRLHANAVDPFELPPKGLSEHLVALYFTHFYPVLPMFYKRRLVCSPSPLEPISPLLLNAIYAIASRVSSDERVRSDPNAPDTAGDVFYERAKCLLDDYYDTPKISTVQALLLMASHQQGAMKSARAWLYSGMAFRMAQDLGLNRNCDHWNISPEERERRKRVFWCCYIVDRITSAIYGRSSNFEERDCDVPFPAVDDDEPIVPAKQDPIRLLQVFTQNIKICDILGHVLKNIYYVKAKHHTDSHYIDQILTTLHRQLLQWHSNLPIALQYKLPNTQIGEQGPDPPSVICQLHLTYYTTMILLHRSFIPGPTQSHLPISLPSYKICESAATSILDIVNIMLGENHLRFVHNFSVFFVFTAGIIFIKVASSTDPDRAFDAKININRIMRALDDLEVTWMNAARCCNILGELAGLRDIELECDKYVPKLDNKHSPPPCIAVPNSPELNRDYQQQDTTAIQSISTQYEWNSSTSSANSTPITQQKELNTNFSLYPISSVRQSIQHARSSSLDSNHHQQKNYTESNQRSSSTSVLHITPTMDPFAAPGIVPGPLPQQEFDPLGTAFWGMPTSLNTEEWNAYFDNIQQQQPQSSPQEQQLTDLLNSTSNSAQQASNYIYEQHQQQQQQQQQHCKLSKSATSSDLPISPSQSILFGFLDDQNQRNNQEQTLVSSPKAIDYHSNNNNSITNTANDVLYW